MKHPIIEHLANLKFYSDFKKSQAKSFDQFVEFIDTGAPGDFVWTPAGGTPAIETFKFDDPILGDTLDKETEEKIEEFLEKERQENHKPKLNLDDWYLNAETEIEYLLKKIHYKIILRKNPFEILNKLLAEYELLKKFISISDNDFYTYTSWMQDRQAEDFLITFSESNKKIENSPLIQCFPRIFKTCKEYKFFILLAEKVVNHRADLSYIFHRMKSDRLIFYYCKQEFQELIDQKFESNITLYNEDKITDKFSINYMEVYKLIY